MDLSTKRRLTRTQAKVLRALASPDTPPLGTAIAKAAGVRRSSVYIVLRRLEDFGFVREQWCSEPVYDAAGRGHRRTYVLTDAGAAYLGGLGRM